MPKARLLKNYALQRTFSYVFGDAMVGGAMTKIYGHGKALKNRLCDAKYDYLCASL